MGWDLHAQESCKILPFLLRYDIFLAKLILLIPNNRITNTAPSPSFLATINGTAASLGCLARTLGPVISGPLFRLGLQAGYVGLPFWTLGVVSGIGLVISQFLRDYP